MDDLKENLSELLCDVKNPSLLTLVCYCTL